MQECVFLISCVFKTLVKTCTLPRVRAPTMWFPESLMTTMQATPSSKMAFYTLSAANAMNNTKALHLAPVPDSMLIGEVGSCSVWPTTGQGARGPPTGSCFLLLSVQRADSVQLQHMHQCQHQQKQYPNETPKTAQDGPLMTLS